MRSMMDAITSSDTFICDWAPDFSARTWRKLERLLLKSASPGSRAYVSVRCKLVTDSNMAIPLDLRSALDAFLQASARVTFASGSNLK